jgi:aspartokinase
MLQADGSLLCPARSIPITIRNFFKPEAPGTVIGDFVTAEDGSGGQFVKGFATIDDVALINVEVCIISNGCRVDSSTHLSAIN